MRRHLHVVPQDPASSPAAAGPAPGSGDGGDLAVMGMLFGVNLVPLVGAAVNRAGWGSGTLGLATFGALVTGRELVRGTRSLLGRRHR